MSKKHAKRSLHWLSWVPTPYNDYLFRMLSNDPEINLTVYYRDRLSESHSWRTQLGQGHEAKYYKPFLRVDWKVLGVALREKKAFFVIAGWEHPTSILLINYLALLGGRFAVWTDTPNLQRRRNPAFALMRSTWLRWVFNRADKIMGTGSPGIAALHEMGAPSEKLVEFQFFLDLDAYKSEYRPDLNPSRPMRFISAGRLKNDLKGHNLVSSSVNKVCG